MGIPVCSKEGPCPFSRGDNHEIYVKNFFSRTNGPVLTKLDIKHPYVKGTLSEGFTNSDHLIKKKDDCFIPFQIKIMI